jgi:GNAT superfamily N-acetyltransferase
MAIERGPALASGSRIVPIATVPPDAWVPWTELSPFFAPFLPHFVREALRCGGEVWASVESAGVDGVMIFHDTEKVASVFTRDRRVAERLSEPKRGASVFSDFELAPSSEPFGLWESDPRFSPESHRFQHAVRPSEPGDLPQLQHLLGDVYGRVDDRWLAETLPREEKGFVVEAESRIVGAAWVTVLGEHGRLHSVSVRPRYRGLGIGTDLWQARILWCRQLGVRRIVTEISDRNLPSRQIAMRGGMHRSGELFRSFRP